MSDVKLFPKRRATDQNVDGNAIGRLLTMTDLMALLLCFFIMLYSTHDPADAKYMRLPSAAIAPAIVPVESESGQNERDTKLVRQKAGLDLNYVAALFRQAQTRDDNLAKASLEAHEHALAVTVPQGDFATAAAALSRLAVSGRIVQVFADERSVEALTRKPKTASVRYFPQNRNDIVILVH